MKNFIIILFFVALANYTSAQVTAGSIPAGTSIKNPNINLTRTADYTDTSAFLDVDCDGVNDLRIYLYQGYPPVDAANSAELHVLNNSLSLCTDTGKYGIITFYNFNDTLCTGYHQWKGDSVYLIGCYGGLQCYPYEGLIINKYIAYQKKSTQQIGWIKISFDLGPAVSLSIPEFLALCYPEAVSEIRNETDLKIFPNPAAGLFKISLNKNIKDGEVTMYNVVGEKVYSESFGGKEKTINCKLSEGIYFVRVGEGERWWVEKVIIE